MPRLPHTSARNTPGVFAKLLSSVDPRASTGFGFEGVFLRPGSDCDLWPGATFPRNVAIVLECAGKTGLTASGRPARGHNRSEVLYILWRYQDGVWAELGRAQSDSWAWAVDLRPLAVRALAEARRTGAEVLPSLEAVTRRIALFLGRELDGLEDRDRGRVLGVLHDQFAWRLAELSS